MQNMRLLAADKHFVGLMIETILIIMTAIVVVGWHALQYAQQSFACALMLQ
jgi:hypothetical protein